MSEQQCYLCSSKRYLVRCGSVRDNPEIEVIECEDCGLVYLSTLEHVSKEHYEESGMHDDGLIDVDTWLRETRTDDERRFQFIKEKVTNKNILDFGCGVGGFLVSAKSIAL